MKQLDGSWMGFHTRGSSCCLCGNFWNLPAKTMDLWISKCPADFFTNKYGQRKVLLWKNESYLLCLNETNRLRRTLHHSGTKFFELSMCTVIFQHSHVKVKKFIFFNRLKKSWRTATLLSFCKDEFTSLWTKVFVLFWKVSVLTPGELLYTVRWSGLNLENLTFWLKI